MTARFSTRVYGVPGGRHTMPGTDDEALASSLIDVWKFIADAGLHPQRVPLDYQARHRRF